jgi:NADH:ubiquinone oxidoreductase subunit E
MPDSSDNRPPRVIVCLGKNCNAAGVGAQLHAQLEAILAEADPFQPPFLLRTANCLDMCDDGPNLVIYPGNIRVNHLDADKLPRGDRDTRPAPRGEARRVV